MRAPLSNRACVWWDFQVSYKDKAEDGTVTVRTLNKGTSVTPFVMQDQDGECLVGPVGAEVTASTTDTWSGYTSNPRRAAATTAPARRWRGLCLPRTADHTRARESVYWAS